MLDEVKHYVFEALCELETRRRVASSVTMNPLVLEVLQLHVANKQNHPA